MLDPSIVFAGNSNLHTCIRLQKSPAFGAKLDIKPAFLPAFTPQNSLHAGTK